MHESKLLSDESSTPSCSHALCVASRGPTTRRCAPWLDPGLQAALVALFLLFSLLFASTAHAQTAPAAPTGLMAMTGDGVGSGNVALNWDDNSESDLAGYNVYRHTASFSDTTTATRINGNMLVASSDFFDSGLFDGTPYYYRVVAVDYVLNQGNASSEVSATMPDRRREGERQHTHLARIADVRR